MCIIAIIEKYAFIVGKFLQPPTLFFVTIYVYLYTIMYVFYVTVYIYIHLCYLYYPIFNTDTSVFYLYYYYFNSSYLQLIAILPMYAVYMCY